MRLEAKVVSACLAFSFAIWLIVITQVRIYNYAADSLWYMKDLPLSFWAGLALTLVLAFWYLGRVKAKAIGFDLCFVFLLTLYLFGTMCFVTKNPYFLDIYSHASEVKFVEKTGSISSVVVSPHLDTPGVYIFFAMLSSITGTGFFESYVVRYYPIFLVATLSVFVYIIARRFSLSKKALSAPITFLSFASFLEFHISRQSFSLILFSILLLSIFALSKSRRIQWAIIFVVASISSVISHPAMPIVFSTGLASLLIFYNLPWSRSVGTSGMYKPKTLGMLLVFGIVIYLCWSVFFPQSFFWLSYRTYFLKSALENLFGNRLATMPALVQNPTHEFATIILTREALLLLEEAVGILSMIILWLNNVRTRTLLLGAFVLGFLPLQALLFFGHSDFGRISLFALFPISILCALSFETLTKSRKQTMFLTFLAIMLVVSMVLFPISGYGGNFPFECPSTSELSVVQFVNASLPRGALITGLHHYGIFQEEQLSRSVVFFDSWIEPNGTLSVPENCDLMILNLEYNYFKLRFGTSAKYEELERIGLSSYNKVCDSGLGRFYEPHN
jgi:hypothetical protein